MQPQDFHSTPFKGLVPYTEEDAQFFFGREDIRDKIIDFLHAYRLTLLYGASGVGKSSVLHAGVVPTLRNRARQSLLDNQRTTPEFSVIVFNSWQDDPVTGLARKIQENLTALLKGTNPPLAEPPTLEAALDQWMAATDGELYVILDQFEEYFQYHGREVGPGTFATDFSRAVSRRNQRIKFLISIREEAVAKLDLFKGALPNLFAHTLRVYPIGLEEARTAIEGPLQQYNSLSGAVPVAIEPQLLEVVLQSVRRAETASDRSGAESGPGKIDLTILQQVMIKLWDEEVVRSGSRALRLETFNRLGGAKEIVSTHFSSAMELLSPADQKTAASIFRYLVTPSGTKIAQTAADLAEYSDLPRETVSGVLAKLSGGEIRILRAISGPHDQPGDVRYEIFHDVLSGPITEWSRAYEANERLERTRIEAIRDRQVVRARYSRRVAVGLFVVLVLTSGFMIYALYQNRELKKAREMDKLYRNAFRQSRRKEQKEEAIKNFEKALAVYLQSREPDNREAATDTYINIGEIHADMGNARDASKYFQDALNRSNNEFERAGLLTSIGDACKEVEPSELDPGVMRSMAAEKYNEALRIYQKNTGWKRQAAAVLVSLALVKIDLSHTSDSWKSEVEKAYKLIEEAVELYKQASDPSGQGFALFTLANAKAGYESYYVGTPEVRQEVMKTLEEALKQYELAQDLQRQILVRKSLIRLHLASRTKEQTEKALAHLSAVAGLYDQLHDEAGRAATQVQIDGIYVTNQGPTVPNKFSYQAPRGR